MTKIKTSFAIEKSISEQIKIQADKEGRSASNLVNHVMMLYLAGKVTSESLSRSCDAAQGKINHP